MSARNKFLILLGIIFVIAASYYFLSTDHSRDLVLIGTVDANQVIVSAQVSGRIQKLLVDEGTPGSIHPSCRRKRLPPPRRSPACNTRWQRCSTQKDRR